MTLAREISFYLTAENFSASCVVAYAHILVSVGAPDEGCLLQPHVEIYPRISLHLHYSKESAQKAYEQLGGIILPTLVSKGLKAFSNGDICLMPKDDAVDYRNEKVFTDKAAITIIKASLPADKNGKFSPQAEEWINSIVDFTELDIFT